MRSRSGWRRVWVERGIYLFAQRQVRGALPARGQAVVSDGRVDLALARTEREALIAPVEAGLAPASPRSGFATVAAWWLARFEAKVGPGERHPRTLESHRYHLDHHLLPAPATRRMSAVR